MAIEEELIAAALTRPSLDDFPVWKTFLEEPAAYQRIHLHVIGIEPSADDEEEGESWFRRIREETPDPYLEVSVQGSDTGCTPWFDMGSHKFPTLHDCEEPVWDAKCLLISKKDGTEELQFVMKDCDVGRDDVLMRFSVPVEELPVAGDGWVDFRKQSEVESEVKAMRDCTLHFRICVSDGADRIVSEEEFRAVHADTEERTYTEEVVDCQDGDHALIQCWRHQEGFGGDKAALWVPGRGDCFMHPHVATELFFANGIDLYVVNYCQIGKCRARGWVSDPFHISHCRSGDFSQYHDEIGGALRLMKEYKEYSAIIGYAHSTGGPVLLDYLMENGDSDFHYFIANSPFLDWGYCGGDLMEVALENVPQLLTTLGVHDMDDVAKGPPETPEEYQGNPLMYMDKEIVMNPKTCKKWSQYYVDWDLRPLYQYSLTYGFAIGATQVMRKLEEKFENGEYPMTKPLLCITSTGDDVLMAGETLSHADWLAEDRTEILLKHAAHDVFLSSWRDDTFEAIETVKEWMMQQGIL